MSAIWQFIVANVRPLAAWLWRELKRPRRMPQGLLVLTFLLGAGLLWWAIDGGRVDVIIDAAREDSLRAVIRRVADSKAALRDSLRSADSLYRELSSRADSDAAAIARLRWLLDHTPNIDENISDTSLANALDRELDVFRAN